MYDSPIELFTTEIQAKFENGIVESLQRFDIDVDRDELLRALKYDRDQYHKGFSDGRASGYAERDEEIVRCFDCKHYRNHPNGLCYAHTEPCDNERGYRGEAVCVEPDDFCSSGERRADEQ